MLGLITNCYLNGIYCHSEFSMQKAWLDMLVCKYFAMQDCWANLQTRLPICDSCLELHAGHGPFYPSLYIGAHSTASRNCQCPMEAPSAKMKMVLPSQALNFTLEGAQQFYSDKGTSTYIITSLCTTCTVWMRKNVNLYWNFAKGTTAKAQGITAIDVCVVGYFEDCVTLSNVCDLCTIVHCVHKCRF